MSDDLMVVNPFGPGGLEKRPDQPVQMAQVEEQRAIAEVQAAVIVAHRFPRDQRAAMDQILLDCTREQLAEVAEYEYVRGNTEISGPSIRLMETIARRWGNIEMGVQELLRHERQSWCRAFAIDLEGNLRDARVFVVPHWRDRKDGSGYFVTDERDIREVIANAGARYKRSCLQTVIPSDVVEAAREQCRSTLKAKGEITPERTAAMLAKFAEFGVTRNMIEKRLQRRLETASPALFSRLGSIWNALRDGVGEVTDYFEPEAPRTPADDPQSKAASQSEALKQRMRATRPKKTRQPEAGPPPMTFEEVETKINAANDSEALAVAADLIKSVQDDGRRSELTKLYLERQQKFDDTSQ